MSVDSGIVLNLIGMIMIKINTKVGDILVVEIPKDVTWWNIVENKLGNFITQTLSLPQQFLQYGKSSNILGKEVTSSNIKEFITDYYNFVKPIVIEYVKKIVNEYIIKPVTEKIKKALKKFVKKVIKEKAERAAKRIKSLKKI